MKKCVIISGAFKDVYSPEEACKVIKESLPSDFEATLVPFCDGGEYTYDVLYGTGQYSEVRVKNVINPFFKKVDSKYLLRGDEAHIVSSEIIRIRPEYDKEKNPLHLTDYGVGQLIKDAMEKGVKHIFLYVGGTSTTCFGFGVAQALGVRFFDSDGQEITKPISPEDILRIKRYDNSSTDFSDVDITVVCDGDAKIYEMRRISSLKISTLYNDDRETILEKLDTCKDIILKMLNGDANTPFGGAGGGIIWGIKLLFSPQFILGGDFFQERLIPEHIFADCDIVFTGEGRYDNSACGKNPVFVARLAKKYNKKVYVICGQIDREKIGNIESDIIKSSDCIEVEENGIDAIITCQRFFDSGLPEIYEDRIRVYKEMTPKYLKEIMRSVLY